MKKPLTEVLSEKKEIIVSYLYGSAVYSKFYQDIDVGLLISNSFKPELMYEAKIAGKLEKKLNNNFGINKPIDVRILNELGWIRKEDVVKLIEESKIISENAYGEDDGTDEIKLIKYLIDREELKSRIEGWKQINK